MRTMVPDPIPVIDVARYAGYFEAQALLPVVVACVASIGLSLLWLAGVTHYLRPRKKDSAKPSH
jgi:hypothetical protein